MTTKTVPLADLIFDYDLYPRHAIDRSYSAEIARSIAAGNGDQIPRPVVDAASLRVIDGFHRITAWRRHLGTGGSIEVELRDYDSPKAMIADAVRLNSTHGRKLDQQDRARSALLLERAGVTVQEIAVTLSTTEARVRELTNVRIVRVRDEAGHEERRPAKPVVYPRAGGDPRVINEEQYATMRSSSGHRTVQTVTQLTRELEDGLVDFSDLGLVDKLWLLHDTIRAVLPRRRGRAGQG